jgi:hypothetical protein
MPLLFRAILAPFVLVATIEATNLILASVPMVASSGYGRWRETQVNKDNL